MQAAADRYDGRLRSDLTLGGCAAGDGAGNPFGDVECGQWYSRSMSSWSLLTALQGGTYNGADQSIGFAPQWQPGNHQSFFTAGTAYGTFSQHTSPTLQTDSMKLVSGSLTLREIHLTIPAGGVTSVAAWVGGNKITISKAVVSGTSLTVMIPPTTVQKGPTLKIQLGLGK